VTSKSQAKIINFAGDKGVDTEAKIYT